MQAVVYSSTASDPSRGKRFSNSGLLDEMESLNVKKQPWRTVM